MNQDSWPSNSSSNAPSSHRKVQQSPSNSSIHSSSSLHHPDSSSSHILAVGQGRPSSPSGDRRKVSNSSTSASGSRSEDTNMIHYTNQGEEEEPFKLPPLSSLGHTLGKNRSEVDDTYLQKVSIPRSRSPPSILHPPIASGMTSGLYSSTPSPTTSTSRADVFMASLLRAAQSPNDASPYQSPMSVHSIVERGGPSTDIQHRPKKRRTSSVQEPLQGSALEAVRRAHGADLGFPRRSETPSDHLSRLHQQLSTVNPLMTTPFAIARETNNPNYQPKPLVMSLYKPPSPSEDSYHSKATPPDTTVKSDHQASTWDRPPPPPPPPQHQYPLPPHQNHQQQHQSLYHQQQHSPTYQRFNASRQSPSRTHPYTYPQLSRSGQSSSAHSLSHDGASPQSFRDQTAISGSSTGSNRVTPSSTSDSYSSALAKRPYISNHEHWNRQLASKASREEQNWMELKDVERKEVIRGNILQAGIELLNTSKHTWHQSNTSIVTRIRCMYANIAQKSYGSEKRFLCPPPVVKISGPMRPCKWACVRVIPGESATPSSISLRSVQVAGASGEEEAIVDANREARFGKLHVGSLSDARGKTFRLQINLLRADLNDDAKRAIVNYDSSLSHPSSVIPVNAWSTFHSSPISVISKPARKSVRTRAASPAIASGSTVCLYNRLNSQTVRTKYLAVDSSSQDNNNSPADICRLVARQDGWEGFSIELLARPIHDPAVIRANQRGLAWDDWGITYGSIVCLRDVNTNVYSDPMLICKVEKGKVEMSGIMGGGYSQDGKVRFQIVGKDREAARRILLGGTTKSKKAGEVNMRTSSSHTSSYPTTMRRGMSSRESSIGSSSAANTSTGQIGTKVTPEPPSGSIGGAVIQMQKVTLMHIQPLPSLDLQDELECDLTSPRSYLCSTAFEGIPEGSTIGGFARSMKQLDSRYHTRQQGMNLDGEEEEKMSSSNVIRRRESSQNIGSVPNTNACPVGYVQPPVDNRSGMLSVDGTSTSGQIDVLEDPFCWTIVTISQTDTSFIEANARQSTGYPHLPSTSLPITPYPCLAAQPSYDVQSHSIAATIHDFYYQDRLPSLSTTNNKSNDNPSYYNNVCASNSIQTSNIAAHEIWLGHFGPLEFDSTSAGSFMSDVTFKLPSIGQIITINQEFQGNNSSDQHHQNYIANEIQLPILFIRAGQGLSFISSHWLHGYFDSRADEKAKLDRQCWNFSLV